MTTVADDVRGGPVSAPPSRLLPGLGFAVLSAMSFGVSGSLAKGLLDVGWTAGAAVTVRVLVAAVVLAVPAVVSLRGRWGLLRSNAGLVAGYGLVAVAGCQLSYFNAVGHMQVGVALLIEYTAPVAVIGWMWLRHGHRPGVLTLVGAVVAAVGLVLVLDLLSGADLSVPGRALGAGRDGRRRDVLRAVGERGQRAAAARAGRRRAHRRRRRTAAGGRRRHRADALLHRTGVVRRHHGRLVAAAARRWAWSPPRWPTSPASRRAGGSAPGWRRSWRCSRCSSRCCSPGCCSASCRGRVQLVGGVLILAGVVVVKLGERGTAAQPIRPASARPGAA